ncbi:MAG: Gfo/Idh/MocA family oxidoreductase [Chloroflexota bacterium]|nr:Gfo/Idh/MocA family oxidoreductase [Chloroflexota bacterium]
MKFIIAGLGSIGRRHLRNLVTLGERDIILYRSHKSTLPDEEVDGFPVETDLEAALAHQPDAVIVANPTALHLDVAIPAAQAGCHLLLEKPIAGEMDCRVNALQEAVERSGIRTLVGFQFRFHPILARIRELIQTEQLGRPLSFHVHWGEYLPDWHPWEDYRQSYAARADLGGGVVNTLSHPLDYVRWLFGEVTSVSALSGHTSDLELDVEDTAEITLGFENGLTGSVHLDYVQRPPSHWLTINFENGQVRWDNATGQADVYAVDSATWETVSPPDDFERNQLFLEETRHFITLIKGEAESRCSLADGIRALQVTEAVHQSSREGCLVKL